eukprot:g40345.t1
MVFSPWPEPEADGSGFLTPTYDSAESWRHVLGRNRNRLFEVPKLSLLQETVPPRRGAAVISLTADKIQTVTVQDRNIEEHLQASFALPRSAI